MKTVNYKNLCELNATKVLINNLFDFLEGWGEFEHLTVNIYDKKLEIIIEPKLLGVHND